MATKEIKRLNKEEKEAKRLQEEELQKQANLEQIGNQFAYLKPNVKNVVEPPKDLDTEDFEKKMWEANDDEWWADGPPSHPLAHPMFSKNKKVEQKEERIMDKKLPEVKPEPIMEEENLPPVDWNNLDAIKEEPIPVAEPKKVEKSKLFKAATAPVNKPKVKGSPSRMMDLLNSKFKVSDAQFVDVPIGDMVWRLKYLGANLLAFALRTTDRLTEQTMDKALLNIVSIAGMAVVGMKDKYDEEFTPTWEAFNVPLKDIKLVDPFNPPFSLHGSMAIEFITWLMADNTNLHLAQKLYEAYDYEFGKLDNIKSYLDERVVYVCNQSECSEILHQFPKFDKDGNEIPYYCPQHGIPMKREE